MFARFFRAPLRAGQADVYTRAVEQKVVPVLQKFHGFRDEMTMISADGKEAIGITFWERQEDLEAYERASNAQVRNALDPFMTGAPDIHNYRVATSTSMQSSMK